MYKLFMNTKDKQNCKWIFHYEDKYVFELKCKKEYKSFIFDVNNLKVKGIAIKKDINHYIFKTMNLCKPVIYSNDFFIDKLCIIIGKDRGDNDNKN